MNLQHVIHFHFADKSIICYYMNTPQKWSISEVLSKEKKAWNISEK